MSSDHIMMMILIDSFPNHVYDVSKERGMSGEFTPSDELAMKKRRVERISCYFCMIKGRSRDSDVE